MNKAITDGLVLTPPPFANGLDVWSRGDGTPGGASYADADDAAFVPSDPDFGGCLEILKTESLQRLRYTGETPLLPGCYLRVRARVKAVSGNRPTVRIAAHAGAAGGGAVQGVVTRGPPVTLETYGEVVEVSAIVGSGPRTGVHMVWGTDALYGHFGVDLSGPNGGVVRIDDLTIEDVTGAFLRDMMDWVDVRDFGAVGDGTTDDRAAFEAADAAAGGRRILVPEGAFRIGGPLVLDSAVRFQGRIVQAAEDRFVLRKGFDLAAYADAFGDELLAFRKAFQALLNEADHDSLDLCGRRIDVTAPVDLQAAVGNRARFETRRVIRNGAFNAVDGPDWDTGVVTSQARYSANNPKTLTDVANVANIEVGSLVAGDGVGREVYVTAKNVGAGTVTLAQELHAPAGVQSYTFRRFRYVLDFSGFEKLSKFALEGVELQMNDRASGVMLAPQGALFQLKDCFVTKPRDRGLTSPGRGCQGMQIDGCNFTSSELSQAATQRTSVGFNVNANDPKIRGNRFQQFGTTMVLCGAGNLLVGNHWFQGDTRTDGARAAGLVLTQTNVKTVITGNYLDNSFVEWTNEHDARPAFSSEFSFGGLSFTGNIFTANDVAASFRWIVVRPCGWGHFINGLTVTGNTFKVLNSTIQRVERLDDSIAALDRGRMRNVTFAGNTFNGVGQATINPVVLDYAQNTNAATWTLAAGAYLPFGGAARTVVAVVPEGEIRTTGGAAVHAMPSVTPRAGAGEGSVRLGWPVPARGRVQVTVRADSPI
ncbi:glycosyl hydrolase family 28-related protein [Tranquillimonas rosea]|uniref:glycosyl hydrolase family 28-related protein n=1 Tax=Tranquillimonas rosea TaxID=641238 RepID=UPI003BA8F477